MTSRTALFAALLAPVLLAACGRSPDTQFLTLDPVPGMPVATAYRGAPVRIPSLEIPPALDRVEFARQTGPGEMKVEDLVHWSASLGMLARNTLILDLAQRLPGDAVAPPDAAARPGGLRATVAILSFGVVGTEASMVATYAFGPEDGQMGAPHWAQLGTPSSGQGPPETARAFSALLGTLADRMAADLVPGAGRTLRVP
jgi:uncharacterized lipoprotein YmbA